MLDRYLQQIEGAMEGGAPAQAAPDTTLKVPEKYNRRQRSLGAAAKRNEKKYNKDKELWVTDEQKRIEWAAMGRTREAQQAFSVAPWTPQGAGAIPPQDLSPSQKYFMLQIAISYRQEIESMTGTAPLYQTFAHELWEMVRSSARDWGRFHNAVLKHIRDWHPDMTDEQAEEVLLEHVQTLT